MTIADAITQAATAVTEDWRLGQLLPPLAPEEFDALRADIAANGVRHPIYVDEKGNVLDGRHRLQIDPKAPRKVIRGLSPAEKEAFVFRANFVRRNLSPAQKAEARKKMQATAIALREEDQKKWTQDAIANAFGVARRTVSDWFDTDIPIGESANGYKAKPDARVVVNREQKADIAARVAAGERQEDIAAAYGITQKTVSQIASRAQALEERRRASAAALEKWEAQSAGDTWHLHHEDFRACADRIDAGTVPLIFTDPPYHDQYVPLYADVGKVALRVLTDGGSLITYTSHHKMPETIRLLEAAGLTFFWPLALIYLAEPWARMREYGVIVKHKPLLWFVKGTFRDRTRLTWVDDAIVSTLEKGLHPWQQSTVEAAYYIEQLTVPGDFVFDPFCGSGTTAIACARLARRWMSCDVDGAALRRARKRVSDEVAAHG